MQKNRYEFFELTIKDPRLDQWERQFLLDRETRTVYLPAVNLVVILTAAAADELIEVNRNPYCPLLLYMEMFPHLSTGLLDFEQRVKASVRC